MTAASRRFLLLIAASALGPAPACVLVGGGGSPDPGPPPAKGNEFAILPSRPGEVVPISRAKGVAGKPADPPTAAAPARPAGKSDPAPEPAPTPAVTVAKAEQIPIPPPPDGPPPPAGTPGTFGPLLAPRDLPEPPVLAAVRAHLENRPDDAFRHLQPLDKASQEFALAVVPLLVRGTQADLAAADPNEVAVIADQFRSLADRLEPRAALRVERVAFCRQGVKGFGQYDPWPDGEPHRAGDLAILYVEARNLGSVPAAGPAGQTFVTRAVVSLEVRDAGGKLYDLTDPAEHRRRVPVARYEHTDYSRSPVHDYYQPYRFRLPGQPGVYTLTVEVKDAVGKRAARSQPVLFTVSGP